MVIAAAAFLMVMLITVVTVLKWVLPVESWLPIFIVIGAILSAIGGAAVFRRFEAALIGFLVVGPIMGALANWAWETIRSLN